MPATPPHPQDVATLTVVVVIVATLCVVYWRMTLRLIAIALMALAIYGAILAFSGLHHAVR